MWMSAKNMVTGILCQLGECGEYEGETATALLLQRALPVVLASGKKRHA